MTQPYKTTSNRGILYALSAALLFGISAPAAKFLLLSAPPQLLAGIFYLGSGFGLFFIMLWRTLRNQNKSQEASLQGQDWSWLALATLFGGILGPVLLMSGLLRTDAASASLLLNLEGALTAALAWFVFREHYDKRIVVGMIFIVAGGLLISWAGSPSWQSFLGPLFIAAACLCWAIDNNVTRQISASDPLQITFIKSVVAGAINLILALSFGSQMPRLSLLTLMGLTGFFGYGLSLYCFVLALRHIGSSRTGAYFSLAPFIGAIISLFFLGGTITWQLAIAAALMAIGIVLHLSENHDHEHTHDELEHEHKHVHDEHHRHQHSANDPIGEPHSHWHRHDPLTHKHPHYPDIHHRHGH